MSSVILSGSVRTPESSIFVIKRFFFNFFNSFEVDKILLSSNGKEPDLKSANA